MENKKYIVCNLYIININYFLIINIGYVYSNRIYLELLNFIFYYFFILKYNSLSLIDL